jgi:septal ring factor EnvC (AmiA/AmiB activator)
MRHLVAFYQGEYAFTPFRVEDLWFVVLTHGVPRIEERGSIGTLLAAMRMHLPPSLSPAIAAREDALRERDREAEARESQLRRREQRLALLEAELRSAAITLRDLEGEVRTRETRLTALRDYALQMQRAFRQAKSKAELPIEAEPMTGRESSGPPSP